MRVVYYLYNEGDLFNLKQSTLLVSAVIKAGNLLVTLAVSCIDGKRKVKQPWSSSHEKQGAHIED
jgi:hypothetical protein